MDQHWELNSPNLNSPDLNQGFWKGRKSRFRRPQEQNDPEGHREATRVRAGVEKGRRAVIGTTEF